MLIKFFFQYKGTITNENLTKFVKLDSSSLSFDTGGQRFGVVYQHSYPTIYAINDENPLAILTADLTSTGESIKKDERTYSTTCTTKHSSFENGWFATGSDDFKGYGWKVPPNDYLKSKRKFIDCHTFIDNNNNHKGNYRRCEFTNFSKQIVIFNVFF